MKTPKYLLLIVTLLVSTGIAFAQRDAPIGTVVIYAGILLDEREHEIIDKGQLITIDGKWLVCNGAALNGNLPEYNPLFKRIGQNHGNGSDDNIATTNFNLPDYRGLFLRGVSGTRSDKWADPEKDKREANHPTGPITSPNSVGTVQGDSTKRPNSGFITKEDGQHGHRIDVETGATRTVAGDLVSNTVTSKTGVNTLPTVDGGRHRHEIEGGDKETRPNNAYVYYLIKYKN